MPMTTEQKDERFIAAADVLVAGKWSIESIRPLAYTREFESMVEAAYGRHDATTCSRAWNLLVQKART